MRNVNGPLVGRGARLGDVGQAAKADRGGGEHVRDLVQGRTSSGSA